MPGSRSWYCPALAAVVVGHLIARHGADLVIVHGGATDVDQAFAEAVERAGDDQEPHPARWGDIHYPAAVVRRDRNGIPYDSAAGPRRNGLMVARGAGLCLAVHRDLAASKGTKDCARLAVAAKIPTYLIATDEAIPALLRADDPRLG